MAAYGAGNPIDILRASAPQTNLMVGNQMLVALDDVMAEAGLDWDDFYPSPLESFTIDGSRYSIPQEVSNYTIFFNTDQAEAAGLDIQNFPSDRDDFIEWVHGHFDVGRLNARVVRLDADLDVVVDDPLNGDEYLHLRSVPGVIGVVFPARRRAPRRLR